jgi:hypothetical protein
MDMASFDRWGRETVVVAGQRALALLPKSSEPELGGEGGPRTTQAGYRSAFVRLTSRHFGRTTIWLLAVPAGHEYSDSRTHARLGAGILDAQLRPFPETMLVPPLGGRQQYFRWTTTCGGWTSHLTYIDAQTDSEPLRSGTELARRAVEGINRLRLLD